MKIEYVLLGVIVSVFIVDYFSKRYKSKFKKLTNGGKVSKKKNWIKLLIIFYVLGLVFSISILLLLYLTDDESKGNDILDFFNNQLNLKLVFIRVAVISYSLSFICSLIYLLFSKTALLNYILKRKKNLSLSILLISIFKLITHFYIYTSRVRDVFGNIKVGDFKFHLDNIFYKELWIFLPIIFIYSIVIWFFNDKIKAR